MIDIEQYIYLGSAKPNSGGGGSAPVIEELNITPTTSAQTITASGGVDGYSPVNVSAVTSSIDANIVADNIKNGVTILGVTGTMSGGGYSELPSYQVSNGIVSRRSGALTGNEFSGITSIGDYGLNCAFNYCSSLTGALDLSSLTSVGDYGMSYTFRGCTGITSVDLSSLISTTGTDGLSYAFQNCTGLISVNLSSLTSLGTYGLHHAFEGCSNLTNINLSSLTSVGGYGLSYAFSGCSGLTSVDFPLLKTLTGFSTMQNCFRGCTSLTNVYFRALTTTSFGNLNELQDIMKNTGSGVTHTLHFPSNMESTIQGLTGYPLFSGTSGYVTLSFDLPATE